MRRTLLLLFGATVLVGCAAGDPRFTADAPASFWTGLWHGTISVITLIIGIFFDTVRVYEVNNTGAWYDFGFLLGVTASWGGGSTAYHRKARQRENEEWKELGRKVETKIRRKIREWAEAEPDDDWEVVGKRAEDKLKRKIREWAESP